MPKTGLKPEDIKTRAIAIAEEEIRKNGVDRLRLTDVARRMHLSHAALYLHFKDREALMDEVSRRWLEIIDGKLSLLVASAMPARRKVKEWFLTLYTEKRERVRKNSELYGAFLVSGEKARPFIADHVKKSRDQLCQILSEGNSTGDWRVKDPRAAAKVLFDGMMVYHHPRFILERRELDERSALSALLEVLLKGIS